MKMKKVGFKIDQCLTCMRPGPGLFCRRAEEQYETYFSLLSCSYFQETSYQKSKLGLTMKNPLFNLKLSVGLLIKKKKFTYES